MSVAGEELRVRESPSTEVQHASYLGGSSEEGRLGGTDRGK